MFESLPRIDLFRRAGFNWDDVDHVLLPLFSSATADRLVEHLQLPQEKLICVSAQDALFLQADHLICPSFPGERRIVAGWSVDFLRRVRAIKPNAKRRRLFVSRHAHKRLLQNEQDIWTELEGLGFERVDPLCEADVESVFHEAEVVVGIHGAGMANIVFCRPGTRVLELMPSDQCVPFYFSVAVAGNLAYDCLVGRSDRNVARSPHQDYNSPYNFKVSVSAFKQRLRWLLSSE
jgi:capsular polysaccharide biosynthesis protein